MGGGTHTTADHDSDLDEDSANIDVIENHSNRGKKEIQVSTVFWNAKNPQKQRRKTYLCLDAKTRIESMGDRTKARRE